MKFFLTLFLACVIYSTYAQNKFVVQYSESNIIVDGKPDEPVWQQLPEYTGFYNHLPIDEGLAENQTSVKLFHNGNNLYISAIYEDSTPRIQISSLKRDDLSNSISSSDAFIIILDTQNQQQSAYYFAVNAGGAQVDGLIERVYDSYGINTSWNVVWKSKTSTDGNFKKHEIEIPLKALNYNKNNPIFGIQFYVRDIKNNSWTIFKNVTRNYYPFDLRFTEAFSVKNLPDISASRFAVTPSVTLNYQDDLIEGNGTATTLKPSLDIQYNVNSSLKLDITINPDFSQIDVDQQVTNLTRFSVFFPERRNFFLENSDLFANLGTDGVNPFYSRRIGADTDIQFGLKLSGNISSKTRLGILNVQTEEEAVASQNYSALVTERQLSKNFTATGFLINRQTTDKFDFLGDYNRVTGINLNYKSNNNKWTGLANYAKSFNDGISGDNSFYNAGIWYNKRGVSWNASVKNIDKNYMADVGFIPRLNNYDDLNDIVVREGYTQSLTGIMLTKFTEDSKTINYFRYVNFSNDTYWNDSGMMTQSSTFYNTAVGFKDLSAVYFNAYYDYVDLKYAFDPLRNGNVLMPSTYRFFRARIGYNSVINKKLVYKGYLHHGEYYSGKNSAAFASVAYRLLPVANIVVSYEINSLDLNELGMKTFHLARFSGEVFFSNHLNWTTYVQYNTQENNFNINSRLQWEYKPLSYVYLVVNDNFNDSISRTNWGVAFKMNYRFDF